MVNLSNHHKISRSGKLHSVMITDWSLAYLLKLTIYWLQEVWFTIHLYTCCQDKFVLQQIRIADTNSLSLANFVGRVVGFLNPPRRTCGASSPKLILW